MQETLNPPSGLTRVQVAEEANALRWRGLAYRKGSPKRAEFFSRAAELERAYAEETP